MKYIVHWEDTKTGETGHGEPIEYKYAIAAVRLGREGLPHVKHWMVEA